MSPIQEGGSDDYRLPAACHDVCPALGSAMVTGLATCPTQRA